MTLSPTPPNPKKGQQKVSVLSIYGEQTFYVRCMGYCNGIYFDYHGAVFADENFIDIAYSTTQPSIKSLKQRWRNK